MANRLIQIVRFVNVPAGGAVSQAHGLNINGVAINPDFVISTVTGFTITADDTNVTAMNNNPIATSVDVWVEHKHTILREFGGVQFTALTPQPLIVPSAGATTLDVVTGNTVFVDAVFGNDATGVRQGAPFATVAAALAVAQAGDSVIVRPGTYDLPAGITIPANVSLTGEDSRTQLRMLNVTADTTMVTMSSGSEMGSIHLELTSSEHHTLVGVDFPGTTTLDARVAESTIIVDNSGAGAGNSDVFGVRSNGTGIANPEFENLHNCQITVDSAGTGNKVGIYVGGANKLFGTILIVHSLAVGGIGVETDDANAIFIGSSALIHGPSGADISETAGSLQIGGASQLQSVNANGLGFDTLFHPNTIQFGDPGNLPSATRYFYPGTNQVSSSIIQVRLPSAAIVKGLSIQVQTAPGVGNTAVFTVQKNGVDTTVTATLADAATEVTDQAHSVGFAAGDKLSLKVVNNGNTADTICVVELF